MGGLRRGFLGELRRIVRTPLRLALFAAPFRALIGHKSDTHRSVLGWRRVPYIWFGTLMQFGGLAIIYTVVTFYLVGDGLNRVLSPKLRNLGKE